LDALGYCLLRKQTLSELILIALTGPDTRARVCIGGHPKRGCGLARVLWCRDFVGCGWTKETSAVRILTHRNFVCGLWILVRTAIVHHVDCIVLGIIAFRTTFLVPAEIFPTSQRTMCHGIAAASGKCGALLAAVLFHYVGDVNMFLLSGYASFVACVVTFWTIPDTAGLDLYEIDRKWRMILNGRKGEYEGPANQPEFISLHELHNHSMRHRQRQSSAYDGTVVLEGLD
jgi:hypothetical protein